MRADLRGVIVRCHTLHPQIARESTHLPARFARDDNTPMKDHFRLAIEH
jgi:hypothetical protein